MVKDVVQSTPVVTKSDITKYLLITKSFNSPEFLLSYYIINTLVKQRNGYNEIPLITKSFKSHIASKLFIITKCVYNELRLQRNSTCN